MRRTFLWALMCLGWIAGARTVSADIMDVNVNGVDPRYRSAFLAAEAFWESRLLRYNPALPAAVRIQLSKLQIVARSTAIDGVGGVLGSAGPTNVVTYGGTGGGPKQISGRPIAIAKNSQMNFDIADIQDLDAQGALLDVIKHEMGHALGFGSLWNQNGLLATVNGGPQYIGAYGLSKYRVESNNRFAGFVPVEQQGGGGTAGAHWDDDDPFFNKRNTLAQSELMIGDIDPGNESKYTTETTWASMADLWFVVKGINDGTFRDVVGGGPSGRRKWIGGPPLYIRGPSAVPEPGSLGVLALVGLAGLAVRRRQRH